MRAEGVTEHVGDISFTCLGSGGAATIQVIIAPPVPVTSAVLASGYTEALAITSSGQVQGVVGNGGSSLTFAAVPIPAAAGRAGTPVTLTNIRVNATRLASGPGVFSPIAAQVFIGGSTFVPALFPPITVAFATSGLGPQSVANVSTASNLFGSPGSDAPANLAVCTTLLPSLPVFFVRFGESFGTAFRQRGSAALDSTLGAWSTQATETGYVPAFWPNTPGYSNVANGGTRIRIRLTNIPQNVAVYFPTSPATDQPGAGALTLTSTATGPLSPVAPVAPNRTNNLPSGAGAPALAFAGTSAGTADAIYEVTSETAATESYSIPVYFAWISGAVQSANLPVQVSVSFAPVDTPSNIPNFTVTGSTVPLIGSAIGDCVTGLLFPFVTTQAGFDTVLIVANASADPFGASGATPQAGTCTLNFYGSGAPVPGTDIPFPSPDGSGILAVGQTLGLPISSIAIGFQGYLIAACNFQYAHGFAYITSGFGAQNAVAIGYLGVALAGRGIGLPPEATGN